MMDIAWTSGGNSVVTFPPGRDDLFVAVLVERGRLRRSGLSTNTTKHCGRLRP